MRFHPDKFTANPGLLLLQSAERSLGIRIVPLREEIADARLARIHAMMLALVNQAPQTEDEFDSFLYELRELAGIFILATAGTSYQSPLWKKYQDVDYMLLDAFWNLKKSARTRAENVTSAPRCSYRPAQATSIFAP